MFPLELPFDHVIGQKVGKFLISAIRNTDLTDKLVD